MLNFKILDCTLRDGGYYTNWDFDKSIVDKYLDAVNLLPIDYIEVGYRSNPSSQYMGKYAYCPVYELDDIRAKTHKKIAIILNEKDIRPADLEQVTKPIIGLVDMVRMAVDPNNIERAVELARCLREQGFEVGFNVMYMSKWLNNKSLIDNLSKVNSVATVFSMVDSYGGVNTNEVEQIYDLVKSKITVPIGFHGHNNLELALANSLILLDKGLDFVDATVLGMGRGAGNLKIELFLTYLSKHFNLEVDFNALGSVVSAFQPLLDKYKWGTNLPYMISGINSFPQKDVMEMVSNRLCSFNSIVRNLDNRKCNLLDNEKFPLLEGYKSKNILIVGGGDNARLHIDGIYEFAKKIGDLTIIHASARNASYYKSLKALQIFCLIGNEGERIKSQYDGFSSFSGKCVLPPYPRRMGTEVSEYLYDKTYELESFSFTKEYPDSCTSLALQIALDLEAENIYIIGYDGYPDGFKSLKDKELTEENMVILDVFTDFYNGKIVSLTPTEYNLKEESLYQYL